MLRTWQPCWQRYVHLGVLCRDPIPSLMCATTLPAQVQLFEGNSFDGDWSANFTDGAYSLSRFVEDGVQDKATSSVKVPAGCQVNTLGVGVRTWLGVGLGLGAGFSTWCWHWDS